MTIVISQSGPNRCPALNIVCRQRLTRHESSYLGHVLRGSQERFQAVEIDLSQVEFIDTAALAVLVAGYVAAIARGTPFTLTGASKAVCDLISLHRLESALPMGAGAFKPKPQLASATVDRA
ncbi:MAG: lipid asymmetry maintenance protein MlaB [Lysobacterales bacterium]